MCSVAAQGGFGLERVVLAHSAAARYSLMQCDLTCEDEALWLIAGRMDDDETTGHEALSRSASRGFCAGVRGRAKYSGRVGHGDGRR